MGELLTQFGEESNMQEMTSPNIEEMNMGTSGNLSLNGICSAAKDSDIGHEGEHDPIQWSLWRVEGDDRLALVALCL